MGRLKRQEPRRVRGDEKEDTVVAPAPTDGVRALAEQVVGRAGLVLEDVTVTPIGRRRLLRITVDLPADVPGGVPIDAVAEASHAISTALDESDVMGGAPYVLEVSSPGVDRPLTERRHFARARGRIVTVTTTLEAPAEGRLTEVDDAGLSFEGGTTLAWEHVIRGKIQVEFSRPGDASEDEVAGRGSDDAYADEDAEYGGEA
jgi:ribosome maturation factor RimP